MPSAHAKLSPSDSSRWISCPAAIGLEESLGIKDEESSFAREGTLAHGLCEIRAGLEFGLSTQLQFNVALAEWQKEFDAEEYPEGTRDEMEEHIATYVELLRDRLALYQGSMLLLEQRMDSGVEKCWGTSDAVIVSTEHVEIVDFKYGSGVAVSAINNSQLRLYGCGALDTFGDLLGDTKVIRMTVHQPRLNSVSTEELTPDELRAWRSDIVAPAAALALHSDDAPFGPSESACRWCPMAGTCRARIEKATREDFGDILAEETPTPTPTPPELISMEELGAVLHRVPEIKAWCAAVEVAALEAAYARGEHIPGWKVVWSGGRRSISDGAGAIQTLIDAGFPAEKVADAKPKALGVLEKLVGKKEFTELLGGFITKSKGRESLVPESDKREAISPAGEAAKDFSAE